MELKRHPWDQVHQGYSISCDLNISNEHIRIEFKIIGNLQALMIESVSQNPVFRDEIWKSTCFELFVLGADDRSYSEFNFAPNGDWAAYHFDDYREGMKNLTIMRPNVELITNEGALSVVIELATETIPINNNGIGICSILETQDGKSYWALKHCKDKPDFHQKHCFLHKLEAR